MAITSSSAGDRLDGVSGTDAAAAVVPSAAPVGEYVGGGVEYGSMDDGDADDLPMNAGGTAAGHADCVPRA
jgi:hypothetical protein